jgi:branched-chain amino acid transport system substrate-binding protein
MGRRVKVLVAVAGLALVAAVTAAVGARTADPGITKNAIKIGGTFPLSGPASPYGTIPLAEKAYFDWFNAHASIHGRKIDFVFYDDAYNPAQTVPLTQKLVEQDKVFAIFNSLGTAPNLAVREYLNQKKVPHVLLATGDSYWGSQYKQFPWTIGYQPDYPGESKIYGKFIQTKVPQAKIGVLMQNDAYGKNYLAGLKAGLGAEGQSKIVDVEPFDVTAPDVTQQMLKLKASGANVFAIFATPSPSIKALVTATKIGWHPQATFLNNVSASPLYLILSARAGADVNGVISTTYLIDPLNPAQADVPGVKLYKAIMAQYYPKGNIADTNNVYGMGAAWTMVYALQHAGNPPTRAGLMKALNSLNTKTDPFLYKGIKLQTSATDHFPIEQQTLIRWQGGATGGWQPFGHLFNNAR